MNGDVQPRFIKTGDGSKQLTDGLAHNCHSVECDAGVCRKAAQAFLDCGSQRGVLHVEAVRRAFAKLPNELVQNQRQAIDRRDELID